MTEAFDVMRVHYRDRDKAARAWKAAGGRVVGYLCETIPEELIEAAGFLPYRISGRPGVDPEIQEKYVYPFEPKAFTAVRQIGLEFVDSMCSLVLGGDYDFVDYLVIPNTRKTILQIFSQLADAKAAFPELNLPETYVLDRTLTPYFSSGLFNRARLFDFKAKLEVWSGKAISESALSAAIVVHNRNRALLGEIVARRNAKPATVSGRDALQIFCSSKFMPKAEHSRLLEDYLATNKASEVHGARLFVGGSPVDHLQLYELIESCGATVVAEDHCWGSRCSDFPVATDIEPMEAIVERYNKVPACSILFPLSETVGRSVGRAVAGGAQGAIFNAFSGDEPQRWDVPDERAALEKRGIPSLYLAEQPYKIVDVDAVRGRISDFIATLSRSNASAPGIAERAR
jgi:benzoyl-CoA reductase/2-hydroxyglutaryl-CoA dehydratase subunit BcrC/BadD/HgdB